LASSTYDTIEFAQIATDSSNVETQMVLKVVYVLSLFFNKSDDLLREKQTSKPQAQPHPILIDVNIGPV